MTPSPGQIVVGSLSQARKHKRAFGAVITLEDPGARPAIRLRFTQKPAPPHLVLAFEDVDDDTLGLSVATEEQVERALNFARDNRDTALLVHCFHGVGRSAAIALAVFADRLGPGREPEAIEQLLAIRPQSTPNIVVVRHADHLLGREGRLIRAVADWEKTTAHMADARQARHRLATERPELYARLRPPP
ncbi:tyrosine phosphatase family protein [Brevundimonas sp. FT23028]|uniref:tyrosine phosphatase family protein n=1 Tax=Brevundimonas sp. FT23028 TaxID=3393748 RepID=UPI003B58ADBB